MSDNTKKTSAIQTNIHKISRFGNITLMVSPEMMAEAGFEPVCCLLTGPEYGPG